MTFKPKGKRGSWFAEVNGELLPCVHHYWVTATKAGMTYDDPHYVASSNVQWDQLVAALREKGVAILTKDRTSDGGLSFERDGYIGLFEIDSVQTMNGHLTFKFVRRLAN
jgi:hypothetical protein